MDLIKYVGSALFGKTRIRVGLYECPACKKFVERPATNGSQAKSCGCARKLFGARNHKYVHGLGKTALHGVWYGIKSRCYDPRHKSYNDYGGRGIRVCEEWLADFLCFRQWSMEHGYSEGMQIDRRDNKRGYAPENCRWVPRQVNAQNRRSVRYCQSQADEVRRLRGAGKKLREIAKELAVSMGFVQNVIYRNSWAKIEINNN